MAAATASLLMVGQQQQEKEVIVIASDDDEEGPAQKKMRPAQPVIYDLASEEDEMENAGKGEVAETTRQGTEDDKEVVEEEDEDADYVYEDEDEYRYRDSSQQRSEGSDGEDGEDRFRVYDDADESAHAHSGGPNSHSPKGHVSLCARLAHTLEMCKFDMPEFQPMDINYMSCIPSKIRISFCVDDQQYEVQLVSQPQDLHRLANVKLVATPSTNEGVGPPGGGKISAAKEKGKKGKGRGSSSKGEGVEGEGGSTNSRPVVRSSKEHAGLERLMERYLPLVIDADGDADVLHGLVVSTLWGGTYLERNVMLGVHKVDVASEEDRVKDAAKVLEVLGPAASTMNIAKRVMRTLAALITHTNQMCVVCGRWDDHVARGSIVPSDRPHACPAELCGFSAMEGPGHALIDAAGETIRNSSFVTDFLLGTIGSAAEHASGDFLFSYAPSEYITEGSNKGTKEISYAPLKRDLIELRTKVCWENMRKAVRGPTKKEAQSLQDDSIRDPEVRLLSVFRDKFKTSHEMFYKLYWWVLKAYNCSFRVVPLERIKGYMCTERASMGTALIGGKAGMQSTVDNYIQQINSMYGIGTVLLEVINDRRMCRYNFERLREQADKGPLKPELGIAFHGSAKANWHSILQNGVKNLSKTKYMTTGAAYGEGVYTATHLGTAMGYARGDGHVAIIEYLTSNGQTSTLTYGGGGVPFGGPADAPALMQSGIVVIKDHVATCPKSLVVEGKVKEDNEEEDEADE